MMRKRKTPGVLRRARCVAVYERKRRMRQEHLGVNSILEGPILHQLLMLFWPILLGTFFQQLYNTADAIIVGQYVGAAGLAAVGGSTGTIISLVVNLLVGVGVGTSVAVAQSYGARRFEDVSRAVHTSVALSIVGGAFFMVLGVLAAPQVLVWMDTPSDVMPHAMGYIRIYFFGTIPSFFYNVAAGVLRAVGDTKRPLYFLMVSCGVNIVLDIVFVGWFQMGATGAAIGTIISQCISALLAGYVLLCDEQPYKLNWKKLRFHGDALWDVLRVGLPTGMGNNMFTLSNLILQASINSFGTVVVAACAAYGKIEGFHWMILDSIGMALTTFSGQNFGAQKMERVRQSVRIGLAMAAGASLFVSVMMCLFNQPLLRMFTQDAEVLELGKGLIYRVVPFYITYIGLEIFNTVVRGCGDALFPVLLMLSGICALRIAWVIWVLPLSRSVYTLMWSYPVSWILTSAMFLIYYLHGGWLRRCQAKLKQKLTKAGA